jgi:Protein of unknown function (DUF2523)
MPAIWAALTSALGWLVRSQIGRWVLIGLGALGIQFAVTEGVVDPLIEHITANVAGAGGAAAAWLGFFNVDRYITLILSAYAAAAATGFVVQKVRAP